MGVPPSEVGYTSAIPRREGHEVHKDMWGHLKKNQLVSLDFLLIQNPSDRTMALGSTQPTTEMSTRSISWR